MEPTFAEFQNRVRIEILDNALDYGVYLVYRGLLGPKADRLEGAPDYIEACKIANKYTGLLDWRKMGCPPM